jgi:hypothetical protein
MEVSTILHVIRSDSFTGMVPLDWIHLDSFECSTGAVFIAIQ